MIRVRTTRLNSLFTTLTLILFGLAPIHSTATTGESGTAEIFDISTYQLDNQIPVITHKRGGNDLFSIQLVAEVGLQDFSCENRHLPHVLEHVLFEETQTFDGTTLRNRVYDKGGNWQGYTANEYTHYTINIHRNFADIAIDTLYRMVSEPTLSSSATANAIRTVNTEMGTSAKGDLQNWISDTLSVGEQGKNRLYPGTNLACRKRQTPNHLTADNVKEIFDAHYVPANFTLLVIGQFDDDQLRQTLNATFGKLDNAPPKKRTPVAENTIDYAPITETEKYGDPSTYLHMFLRADGKSELTQHAWSLVSLYLTEQLFSAIRSQRGIGYSPRVTYNAGTDIGHLHMTVRTTGEWLEEVEQLSLSIYQSLVKNGIPDEDIERLKKRMLYIFESSERRNTQLFQLYRHNRQWIREHGTMRNMIHEINALSSKDIDAILQRLPEKPLVAVLRPNSLWEAIFKVLGIVAIAALLALPVLKRSRNKKAQQ